ncbi:TPA: hypothetical protein ACNR0A_004578 [Escherichia coli]
MSVTDVVVPATATATATATVLLFPAALILTTAVLSCLPGAPASLRRTRWRGFGLSLRSDA